MSYTEKEKIIQNKKLISFLFPTSVATEQILIIPNFCQKTTKIVENLPVF